MILSMHSQIVSYLNGQHGHSETGPIYAALRDGSLAAAIGHMTEHEMSSSIILALLELCVAKNTSDCTGLCVWWWGACLSA